VRLWGRRGDVLGAAEDLIKCAQRELGIGRCCLGTTGTGMVPEVFWSEGRSVGVLPVLDSNMQEEC
jgi:hypothetical protein